MEAEITVGVIIVTSRFLRWTISRVVLRKGATCNACQNWGILNAHAGELEEVTTSGEDEDE